MISEKLRRLISLLPDRPGVYLMKDASDRIIYIGKAKNLKNRVSQYFLRPQSGKVAAMVSHVDHFETIIVGSDKEAFILEQNLIQTHYPRYNIMLMDDSHYPYIALKRHDDPMLKIARDTKDSHYFYFGPFPSSFAARQTIDLLNKIYPTRKCAHIPNKPCLYYSMGQCLAPCIKPLGKEKAEELYSSIKRFMNGDNGEAVALLRKRMAEAVERLDYETAGECKKSIDALEHVTEGQSVEISSSIRDGDVFAFAERDSYLCLAILTYRRGKLLGKTTHVVPSFLSPEETALDCVLQYYQNHELPPLVVTRIQGAKEALACIYEGVIVQVPEEGKLSDVISIASLNARQGLDAHFLTARLEDDNAAILDELGELLSMDTPLRIELFDNSHLQGSSPVGAMVCYVNGAPAKKMYRKFLLPEDVAGDDYHSMAHVVGRRYGRLKEEGAEYPDLILVDGGLPQVHAAQEGLSQVHVDIPVYGLFKNDRHQTSGLIDGEGKTYPLDAKSPLFFLLMRMQDEVHRYAISFHRQKRGKAMVNSIFDGVPGLGAKRREKLQSTYPSIDALLGASLGELSQIIPEESALALYKKLHGNKG
ncbi:MAG: excinuclease ABC subunit UvrC [Bacilli bacterium]|nr:excinuclease ABC subunit UvrC [Bacilli bacterium]